MEDKKNTIIKKSVSISAIVLVGKVLGFFKQAVIAWAFGANSVTDIYFAADGYTSMFGHIMGQSVSPIVLTQYVKLKEEGKEGESKRLIRNSYLFFACLSFGLIIINVLFADQICNLIGISYSVEQKVELKYFLNALFPVVLFTALAGVSQGYLDAHNRFLPGKLCSLFFSASIIVFVFIFKDTLGLRALLIGFLLGYLLHTMYVVFLVIPKVGVSINNPFKNADFRIMLRRFIPLVVGNSTVDLGHLVDKVVASSLTTGSVSALYYGQVISSDIINAVIITSVGTVLLTSISKSVASNVDTESLVDRIRNIICTMTLVTGVITILYLVVGVDMTKMFFERGSFDSSNTKTVYSIASFYAVGFIFMANKEILTKTHYAFHDTISPMINSIIGVLVNLIGSIFLSKIMGVSGISLATSISLLIVFVLSGLTLKKHIHVYIINGKCCLDVLKVLLAMGVSFIAGKFTIFYLYDAYYIIRLVVVSVVIMISYLIVTFLTKEKAIYDLYRRIRRQKDIP